MRMKRIPIVGVTAGCDENGKIVLAGEYVRAITEAMAMPIVLPRVLEKKEIWYQMQAVDALILSGGGDVAPLIYGQEPQRGIGLVDSARDVWEIALCRQMIQASKPILGICRGMQVLNIALGGDVYADINARQDGIVHQQTSERGSLWHTLHCTAGSLMERLFGTTIAVNSYHHQAVRRLGIGLSATAMASDGIIEAIEHDSSRAIGVQYHPELLSGMRPLWQAFVKMAETVSA